MAASFISEPIVPVRGTFDAAGMSRGEPGLPGRFRWRKKEFVVAQTLEQWRDHGDCRHGSGERYVRRHSYRIRTADGSVMHVYFQRSAGRGKLTRSPRWWLHSIESCATHPATPD
jgi:Family of unknown function (DUF6504)